MRNQALNTMIGKFRRLVSLRRAPLVAGTLNMDGVKATRKSRSVGDLSDVRRIELLALTKVVGSWRELDAEYHRRGFEIVHVGDRLYLAELYPVREVICEMSELGYGATLKDLNLRFGGQRSQA
ncbi:hypothetical protein [Pseudomonas sp. S4_EA_1b]|uniref:hypothetical protein n=1 Tax=Pseudomonas sp. S4_EA_1b TaxID=2796960 RepID=UPI0018E60E95|nr:hypothetical protein [Pseudomonas sp. S4_EA_1b]MBI6601013.1 hypothetical protein [Pseudomonas sp. S4_EA_1b]